MTNTLATTLEAEEFDSQIKPHMQQIYAYGVYLNRYII